MPCISTGRLGKIYDGLGRSGSADRGIQRGAQGLRGGNNFYIEPLRAQGWRMLEYAVSRLAMQLTQLVQRYPAPPP